MNARSRGWIAGVGSTLLLAAWLIGCGHDAPPAAAPPPPPPPAAAPADASSTDAPPAAGREGHEAHRGPPPEAVDACKGKSAGDACSFAHRDHNMDGKCAAPPHGKDGELSCRPAHPPEGAPPQE